MIFYRKFGRMAKTRANNERMTRMSTDQHLIAEIKRELDWAAEEVKRTESEVLRLEKKFSQAIQKADEIDHARLYEEKLHLQGRVGLHDAYSLQRRAATRFATLCHVFEIASREKSSEDIREELCHFMYRAIDGEPENADQKDKLLELSEALKAYFEDGYSNEADEAIREAWQNIEETIRGLGRKV